MNVLLAVLFWLSALPAGLGLAWTAMRVQDWWMRRTDHG